MTKEKTRDPFHAGEQFLQSKYGSRENLARNGHRIILAELTEELQLFFQSLSYVAMASLDESGRLRPTLLFGKTGFIQIIAANKIMLTLLENEHSLKIGDHIAMLGIDFSNRRRNRINGRVCLVEHNNFHIKVEQAYGNCPKYIQQRTLHKEYHAPTVNIETPSQRQNHLSEEMLSIIKRADTSFIASHHLCDKDDYGNSPQAYGIDISHRGGYPGFIQAVDKYRLIMPDYKGNRFFNTLGNLHVNPKAALLIVDFENGNLLQLTCLCQIHHGPAEKHWPTGAERLLEFSLEEAELRANALPTRWPLNSYSPFLEFKRSRSI